MKGKKRLTVLIVIAVLAVAFLVRVTYENNQVPVLGITDGQFTPVSSKPNNVSSQAQDPKKKVDTWPFKSDASETITSIKQAISSYGSGEIMSESDNYVYVVFTTSLMRYKDDVEFFLDEANQVVHFRSSSRAGYSDLGLNRKRYNELKALYSK